MTFLRAFAQGLRVGSRDFGDYWTWKSWFGGWLMMLVTNATMWVMLGKLLHDPARLNFLLVGYAAMAGVGTATVQAMSWDRYAGVYPLQIASPQGPAAAVLGRAGFWVIGWLPSSLCTFLLLAVMFGWRCSPVAAVLIPVFEIVICLGVYGLAAFLGSVIAAVPRLRNILGALFVTLLTTICGVSVPVDHWPGWVQAIAAGLPVTHGLAALRLLIADGPAVSIAMEAGLELVVGAAWLALALVIFAQFAGSGRRDGSIDFREG